MDEVRTERLLWRLPREGDFEALLRLVSDYEVVKWTGSWPHPADPEFTRRLCRVMDTARGFSGPVFLGDALIGTMGIEIGELSYMFASQHWGQGYATELGQAMVSHAFRTMDWDRLTARTGQDNTGSSRVLEKLGFVCTGEGQCSSVAQGSDLDSFEYELTRDDWLAGRPAILPDDT